VAVGCHNISCFFLESEPSWLELKGDDSLDLLVEAEARKALAVSANELTRVDVCMIICLLDGCSLC
jgi:hypothetical protein